MAPPSTSSPTTVAPPDELVHILCWVVVAISVNSVAVSFLLGWHWATDLLGGLIAGGLFLRILVQCDRQTRYRWAPMDNFTATSS